MFPPIYRKAGVPVSGVEEERQSFWNSRAALGAAAGSNDVTLKALEIQHIARFLEGCESVLDAGCGNGVTAVSMLKSMTVGRLYGFDYADAMVQEAARHARDEGVAERFSVEIGDLLSPPFPNGFFDAVYTERSLINLSGAEPQRQAIGKLLEKVKPSGRMVLCESFVDGLEEINAFRVPLGLPAIEQPWHNRYMKLDDLSSMLPSNVKILEISNFSSTYYFLSRVINAWEARRDGVEPSYDAAVNQLAFSLPSLQLCAQTKIIVLGWR